MPQNPKPSELYGLSALGVPGALPRLAAIGAILAVVAGSFLYVGGVFSAETLTPKRMIDAFEKTNGVHPGFRRNHAKGVCIIGSFASNGQGQRLSKAALFMPDVVTPVMGRLALSSAMPDAGDGEGPVRSMALSFRLANGEEWRTGMNNIPVFPFRNAQDFYDQLTAAVPDPATGKPDPAKLKAFVESHPATANALKLIGGNAFAAGFAADSYNGLNAFRFVNAEGVATPVRWAMNAVDPFQPLDGAKAAADPDKNAAFDALAARVAQGPLQWHLVATIGQAGDVTNDATVVWPGEREHVDLGTLTVEKLETEGPGNCRDITYDPLVLPNGIEGSDDPLLSARSASYAVSLKRRDGEAKSPSAVQIPAGN